MKLRQKPPPSGERVAAALYELSALCYEGWAAGILLNRDSYQTSAEQIVAHALTILDPAITLPPGRVARVQALLTPHLVAFLMDAADRAASEASAFRSKARELREGGEA